MTQGVPSLSYRKEEGEGGIIHATMGSRAHTWGTEDSKTRCRRKQQAYIYYRTGDETLLIDEMEG
ncbi:hypothetical protein B1690_13485 [Geobacillus sp. 46C-IIa]|nr:hypothetical protein B1690_13485 [Geobacillus sp. 46C-IIa]